MSDTNIQDDVRLPWKATPGHHTATTESLTTCHHLPPLPVGSTDVRKGAPNASNTTVEGEGARSGRRPGVARRKWSALVSPGQPWSACSHVLPCGKMGKIKGWGETRQESLQELRSSMSQDVPHSPLAMQNPEPHSTNEILEHRLEVVPRAFPSSPKRPKRQSCPKPSVIPFVFEIREETGGVRRLSCRLLLPRQSFYRWLTGLQQPIVVADLNNYVQYKCTTAHKVTRAKSEQCVFPGAAGCSQVQPHSLLRFKCRRGIWQGHCKDLQGRCANSPKPELTIVQNEREVFTGLHLS